MRHLRVYTGVDGQSKRSGWEADTFSTVAAQNVIVDHCTFLWGIDENMSASGPRFTGKSVEEWRKGTSHNISFSNNLAAEGLADASHPKGEHSKEIGRAHVCTPVTHAHLVCRLLLAKKNNHKL